MLALVLGALVAAAPLTPPDMEERTARHVLQEFERVGRRSPQVDPALTEAARVLARRALDDSPAGAVEEPALTEAISDAGGADPTPRSYVVRAGEREHALETILERKDLSQERATHLGVGVAVDGSRSALVVLLAERKATLQRFPRVFDTPTTQGLCGEFTAPLRGAQVFVTLPDGRVERPALTRQAEASFCTRLLLAQPGRYTVEVVGRGERGPEVAALFLVDVGTPRRQGEGTRVEEPTSVEAAREAVLERINALRRAQGLPPLSIDRTLEEVAQAYSERMAREGFFAHVAPDGSDLSSRLRAAGAQARVSGENLGTASGALAAHSGIEHSPGHRNNLLGAHFTHVGLGVSFHSVDGRPQVLLTEVFASSGGASRPADPREDVYQALAAHRASHELAPLRRLPSLERIALEQARRALAANVPPSQLPGEPVHERVFRALNDNARSASVDFYVTDNPSRLPDSKNLADRKTTVMGVGTVRGDSPTYGEGRYWVVVIYAATR
ncbi:hypothetical protein CYFUS_004228 [Cystobacter fuscus]|uniref:SCP domain-containing protein n=1 Tax=Cystobacter fuscus TaxID=43 RepID=A0A250J5B6_9BACT|nr:CAP domain-containing protein [Cystobacter fuscus]ATB38793.1 hypothetical protein CYFUS_004228 [Cystobacter fuscus]